MEALDFIAALVWLAACVTRTAIQGAKNAYTRLAARKWANTEALIEAISKAENMLGSFRIDYEYKVDGSYYGGTRITEWFTSDAAGQYICRATYVIYYDLQQPARSWLPDNAVLLSKPIAADEFRPS